MHTRLVFISLFWIICLLTFLWLFVSTIYHDVSPVYPLSYQVEDSVRIQGHSEFEMRFRVPYDDLIGIKLMGEVTDESSAESIVHLYVEDSDVGYQFPVSGWQLALGPLLEIELPSEINAQGKWIHLRFETITLDESNPLYLKWDRNPALERSSFRTELFIDGELQKKNLVFAPVFRERDEQIMSSDLYDIGDEFSHLTNALRLNKPAWVNAVMSISVAILFIAINVWWWFFLAKNPVTLKGWYWLVLSLVMMYLLG